MLLWIIISAALVGSLQFGFQIAVLNCSMDAIQTSFDITSQSLSSFIVSSVLIGALCGSMIAGNVADSRGPKRAIVLCSLFYMSGSIGSSIANTVGVFVFSRLLTGVGVGSSSILVPRYLVEISPPESRGYLSSLNQVFICIGILLAFVMGLGYENDANFTAFGIQWWRITLFFPGIIMSLTQAVVMHCYCPESPVWTARTLHAEEAEEQQSFLRSERHERDGHRTIVSILVSKKYRNIVRLALVIPISQQASGINAVILYGSNIMKEVLPPGSSSLWANMMIGVMNLLCSTISSTLIDKIGRRPCLIVSFFGMAVALFALSTAHGAGAFWSLLVYVCFFGIGCGGVPWVYLSEILPDEIKKDVQGLATTGNWVTNILVGSTFGFFSGDLGMAFFGYGLCCLLSGIFCVRYMVETNQKTLNDIHKELLVD